MALKNLLTKFKPPEETKEYFFAIELTDDFVKSAVWTVSDGQTQVVKIGPTKSWDGKTAAKLISQADASVSQASANLSPEPNGAIFGLPDSWLDKDDILPDKKTFLKTICQELELKPLGFVVTNTAVIQYLKIEEGTPPSAIFLQINSTEINLSLVKLGKIIGNQLVGRSGDLGADVEEGLSRFEQVDALPSRMILYDGQSDFEEDKQQLISYDWEEKLPFVHFPKVEALSQEASIKAISLAGGGEVAKSLGFEIRPAEKKPKLQAEPQNKPQAEAEVSSEVSFSNEDIALAEKEEREKEKPIVESAPAPMVAPEARLKFKFPAILPKISKLIQLIKQKLISFKKTPKSLSVIAAGFFGLLIVVFLAYWFLPKARVIIYFEPKTLEEELSFSLDSKAKSLDLVQAVIPGEAAEISVEGSQTAPTTGSKLIGDSASGEITLYNKTDESKTFPAATTLVGPGNLAFSLDEETTVASSSSQDEGTTFGKANAKVTAKGIGSESNLGANSKLTFKDYSEDECYAKVNSGLAGGSSQEVKAVSQQDQDGLLAKLTEELKEKAQQELRDRLGSNKNIIIPKDGVEIVSKKFNHETDEVADSLALEAKLNYSTLSYNQSDLDLLLQEALKTKIPANFQLSQALEVELTPVSLTPSSVTKFVAEIQAKLIPKLNLEEIKQKLKGHYPYTTQEFLGSLPSFVKADIVIKPNLPSVLKTLPHVAKNIVIEIKTE